MITPDEEQALIDWANECDDSLKATTGDTAIAVLEVARGLRDRGRRSVTLSELTDIRALSYAATEYSTLINLSERRLAEAKTPHLDQWTARRLITDTNIQTVLIRIMRRLYARERGDGCELCGCDKLSHGDG